MPSRGPRATAPGATALRADPRGTGVGGTGWMCRGGGTSTTSASRRRAVRRGTEAPPAEGGLRVGLSKTADGGKDPDAEEDPADRVPGASGSDHGADHGVGGKSQHEGEHLEVGRAAATQLHGHSQPDPGGREGPQQPGGDGGPANLHAITPVRPLQCAERLRIVTPRAQEL